MAPCWSPTSAAIGTPSVVFAYTCDVGLISAKTSRGIAKSAKSSVSQSSVSKFISAVRLAFVTSVANVPPDKFQRIQESKVPIRAVPAFTASATAGTFSISHFILLAEKYGAIARPVR